MLSIIYIMGKLYYKDMHLRTKSILDQPLSHFVVDEYHFIHENSVYSLYLGWGAEERELRVYDRQNHNKHQIGEFIALIPHEEYIKGLLNEHQVAVYLRANGLKYED